MDGAGKSWPVVEGAGTVLPGRDDQDDMMYGKSRRSQCGVEAYCGG